MADEASTELREIFNPARYRQVANLLAQAVPDFDRKRFLAIATVGLAELSLLQRMRRMTEACRATLPDDYLAALAVLKEIAPGIESGFVSIFLCDFVGLYGHDHFEASMEALAHFTRLGSAEFAIREFIKRDPKRTLAVLQKWSRHEDEDLRRLASEGSRPRLPWSFRLTAFIADPSPVLPILHALRADSSLYVRKSVANHLNDISKDHPDLLFEVIAGWPRTNPHTAWIIKHALRSLVKRGDRRALAEIGATHQASVKLTRLKLSPRVLSIGQAMEFSFQIKSQAKKSQRLIVDYIVHYMKGSGKTSPKVFKLREITLAPAGLTTVQKRHRFEELTTRRHYPGRHRLEIMVNGTVVGRAQFLLLAQAKPKPL